MSTSLKMEIGVIESYEADKGFGFITRVTSGKMIFLKSDTRCGVEKLTVGAIVEFDAVFNKKFKREEAHIIDLIKNIPDEGQRRSIFKDSNNQRFLSEQYRRLSRRERPSFESSCPAEAYVYLSPLRENMDYLKRLDLTAACFVGSNTEIQMSTDELATLLEKNPKAFCDRMPKEVFLRYPALLKILPKNDFILGTLLDLNRMGDQLFQEVVTEEILARVEHSAPFSSVLEAQTDNLIMNHLIKHQEWKKFLSPKMRLSLLGFNENSRGGILEIQQDVKSALVEILEQAKKRVKKRLKREKDKYRYDEINCFGIKVDDVHSERTEYDEVFEIVEKYLGIDSLAKDDDLREFVPLGKRLKLLIDRYKSSDIDGTCKAELIRFVLSLAVQEIGWKYILSILPSELLGDIFLSLPKEHCTQELHERVTLPALKRNDYSYWNRFSVGEKLAFMLLNQDFFGTLLNFSETNKLCLVVYYLLNAKHNLQRKEELFRKAHSVLQDYVCDQAWENTDGSIHVEQLLPRCPNGVVTYCEGRPWPTEDEVAREKSESVTIRVSRAFCPRKKLPCGLSDSPTFQDGGLHGASLYDNKNLKSSEWTLLELLTNAGVVPRLPELRRPDEYVPRLCGWVNRLNEIRERLKCSKCGKIMRPHLGYARNLARYNSTIVSCLEGQGHDKDIYLSHCWACESMIDSRENRHKYDKYYLCLTCGSGPQESRNFTQGDICPKCGSQKMRKSIYKSDRNYYCPNSNCKHEIWLPPEHKLTG